MGAVDRFDRFQRSHRVIGFPLAVVYKYVDDHGAYLAALITYYGFISLFPLLLLLSTILGFVLVGDHHAQQQVLHSTLSQFPVIGDQLHDPAHLGGGTAGIIIGSIGALYGGLGVAQAAQHAMNTAWTVPRNERPNPFAARGRSLILLLTIGLSLMATTYLSALGAGAGASAHRTAATVASVAVGAVVFTFAFRVSTGRDLTVRQVLPGALLATASWTLLQMFGATYVAHVVRHASATNSVFALVLGLIAFIYLASVSLVFCVEINVVRVDQLHPRALLTPFTDDVDLTAGDRRSYTDQAEAQRSKGFERIMVTFGRRPRR